jgi:PAS domain S-box-containing protein
MRWRRIALATAVGITYVITGKVGLDFAFLHASATPVWPPAGIALAAMLLWGSGLWPVVFAGAFLINVSTAGSVATSVGIAAGNTLEALVGALLVRRYAGGANALDRPRDIFLFVVLAGFTSTIISATVGVTSLALAGFALWEAYGSIWLTWWLGDLVGDLIVAPLILLWACQPGLGSLRGRWPEALLLAATVAAAGLCVFGGILPGAATNRPIAFLCIPVLLWTALRFGQREAVTVIAFLAGIAAVGTVRGVGPFAVSSANESLLLVQAFMGTMAVTMLPVGAGVLARQRAERSARETEEGLRLAVEAGHMGTWEWAVDRGTVLWSPALEAIHGLAPGTFAGTFAAFRAEVHPEDLARVEKSIAHSLQTGTHHLEYRIVHADGSVRWLEARGEVSYDEAGRAVRVRGVCLDITARKDAEAERERLLEQERAARARAEDVERRLGLVGEIARSIIASLDLDTVLRRIADGAQTLCRSDTAAIFLRAGDGMQPRYRVGPWPPGYPVPPVRPGGGIGGLVMQTGRPTRSDHYAIDPRVSAIYHDMARETGIVALMVVPIIIRTDVAGLLYVSNRTPRVFTDEDEAVCTQLAEQAAIAIQNAALFARQEVARAEAEAANNAKDRFLAMLGHELRNPLGAISNAAQVLGLAGDAGPLVARAQGIISRQAQQLGRLVDDLLDVSRVTSGKVTLDRRPLELAELVRRAVALLGVLGDGRSRRLAVEAEEVWVEGDAARLEQVVVNLLENAVKYTPADGEITVRVARDGEAAVLTVRDTGVGIPADLAPRIFDLFVQGDHSLDRRKGGLGIGLTLVRSLVELHGGTVAATSGGDGHGSTFTVRLPVIPSPAASGIRAAALPAIPARRVLVIEDNADSRLSLRELIRQLGHDVHEAADGVTGVASALDLAPDLTLVDIGLPGLDGYEVARQLRSHPIGRTLRLVALTGYGLPEDRERALAAGFDLHLVKPIDPVNLATLLAEARPDRTGGPDGIGIA